MWAFFLGSVYGAIIANRMPRVRCAHQVCTFNQICRNGEDLWHLEVGQEWRCELDETLFAELQAHRPVLGVSCVLAWGEGARLRGWSCGAGVRRSRAGQLLTLRCSANCWQDILLTPPTTGSAAVNYNHFNR